RHLARLPAGHRPAAARARVRAARLRRVARAWKQSGGAPVDGRQRPEAELMNSRPLRVGPARRGPLALALGAIAVAALVVTSSPFVVVTIGSFVPVFVQQASKRGTVASITIQPTAAVTAGN